MKNRNQIYLLCSFILFAFAAWLSAEVTGCRSQRLVQTGVHDTVEKISIKEREVYITDTIKVKSVAWKTKDSLIFVDSEVPCNDTAFIAQSDSIIVPTGDTLHLAFNYAERKGAYSLVYRPRPDSIILKTITIPVKENRFPFEETIGAFGIGILLGVGVMLQNK